jgi:large subunit ribosomal protein L16
MLFPKKVKHRKWFTKRKNAAKEAEKTETRGLEVSFGSYGLKAMKYGRVTSNQIESARKAAMHNAGKTGKVWIRIFPDHPFTQKPAEVKMGKGKGEPVGFTALVKPGRIMFEIDGVEPAVAHEALRKAGTKLPMKTKIVSRA